MMFLNSSQLQEPRFSLSSQGRKRRRAPTNVLLVQILAATSTGIIFRVNAFMTPILLPLHSQCTTSHDAAKSFSSSSVLSSSTPLRASEKIVTALSSKPQRRSSNVSGEQSLPTTTFDKLSLLQPQRRTVKAASKLQQQHSRLSVLEQQELFHHVVEVRRIRKVELQLEQEYYNDIIVKAQPVMYVKPPYKSVLSDIGTVSMLELSRSTGYGNNVNELETSLILGQQAREKLITTNMGLVHYCLRDILKYRTLRSITMEDLIQEGAIGLSRAVDKYNPSLFVYSETNEMENEENRIKITSSLSRVAAASTSSTYSGGAKFSTYAVYWIRAAMLRTISERDDIMRVPEHVTTAIRKISNVAHAHGYQWEGVNSGPDNYENYHHVDEVSTISAGASMSDSAVEDDIEQAPSLSSSVYWLNNDRQNPQEKDMARMIADETGYSDQMVQNALMVRNRRNKYSSTVLSYESWMQQGKHYETDNSDFVQQQSSSLTWDEPMPNMEHMKQTLSRFLRPKEMEALSWRYGLNDNHDIESKNASTSNPLAKRDYLAAAEIELFGSTTTTTALTKPKSTKNQSIVKGKWGEAMSFNDVGKQMQVSAEYGRRLCHAALQKLRRAVDDGKLEPALLL